MAFVISGDAATTRTNLGLGTAATLDVGSGANNIVQRDGSGKIDAAGLSGTLPALDGSALTGISSILLGYHTATNSTRTGLSTTSSRIVMWNALSFTKTKANSFLRISLIMPLGGVGSTYPHFGEAFIRLSTSSYDANGSDIHGLIHNTRATSNNMGAIYTADFLYDTTGTNISGTGAVYVSLGYDSAGGDLHPAPIWNPNSSDDDRSWQSVSNIIIEELDNG